MKTEASKRRGSHQYALISVLVVLLICLNLWQWRMMPLFPDEVAYSIQNSRFDIDNGVIFDWFKLSV